ncbi:metallophosphoesterase [Azoarcus sp. KH32C]|uniref:metallophosphoesterase family protein n=1 Tax=Azoarcus sp. KH32C TaxID=748247 RepID=UPI0002386743|nr:metallophosphoesterase family protein [Azoarcus sp. KH32C]BAL24756.1 hypothetical protein AZKH_2450 [Azoarcus sp. KH32C]
MRIALVSDIHGNLPALEAVVADVRRRGVDRIVNLGDNVSGPLLPRETAEFLMNEGWLSLAGNHDRQVLEWGQESPDAGDRYAHGCLTEREFAWLRSLPSSCRLADDILLCHGTPTSDCNYFLESVDSSGMHIASAKEIAERLGAEAARLVACGHTHTPRTVRTATGQLIVNPGSVGLPAYDDDMPYRHYAETGSPDARYAVVERVDGRWMAQLIAVPYDFEPMACLAGRNGRPEWERALSTGYAR